MDNYQCNLNKCGKNDTKDYCIGKQGALYESGLFGSVSDVNLEKSYINGVVTLYDKSEVNCQCTKDNTSGCKDRYSNYNCIDKSNFNAGEGKYVLQGTVDSTNFKNRQQFNLKSYDTMVHKIILVDINCQLIGADVLNQIWIIYNS